MPEGTLVVAGGGIGGLSAALALAGRGFDVTVLERSPALSPAGAGIQLSPNASRVLLELGLGPALEGAMSEPEAVIARRAADGSEIVRMPLRGARERWGAPYGVIHRADLQEILHARCLRSDRIRLVLGSGVTGFSETESGGVVDLERGGQASRLACDALVGADGVRSTLRRAILPGYEPRRTGLRAWRALLPLGDLPHMMRPAATTLWLGRSAHVVHYPVRAGRWLNIVAVTGDAGSGDGWSDRRGAGELLERLAGWAPDLREAIAAAADWQTWPLYEGAAETPMAKGRMALLGDAAHAVLPFLAQGGALAIEDGAVLAAWLADGRGGVPDRLAGYAASRSARVRRLRQGSRANGRRYHSGFPVARLRDLLLRTLGGEAVLNRNDWIYRWTPADEAPRRTP
jgi:salicylate hydroxylase